MTGTHNRHGSGLYYATRPATYPPSDGKGRQRRAGRTTDIWVGGMIWVRLNYNYFPFQSHLIFQTVALLKFFFVRYSFMTERRGGYNIFLSRKTEIVKLASKKLSDT